MSVISVRYNEWIDQRERCDTRWVLMSEGIEKCY